MTTTMKAYGRTSMERIIWAAMFTPGPNNRWGLPLVLVGAPGEAKTSTFKRLARAAGLRFEGVVSSLREPSDFLGLPVPTRLKLEGAARALSANGDDVLTVMEYAPANFAVSAALGKRALILLDEVNTARPSVQAALLRLVNEGVCGELDLPPTVRFMLAMNRVSEAAGGWEIAPSLANRMGWIDWPNVDPQRWTEYLMGAGAAQDESADPAALEAAVTAAWPGAWARAAGTLAGFIAAKPDALSRLPPAGSPAASGPWPSPRTNEMAGLAIAGAHVWGLSDKEENELVASFIGAGAAGELHTWRKNNDLPAPADVLDGAVVFKHNPARLDRTAAVLAACTSLVVRPDCPQRTERANKLWEIHASLMDTAADVALSSVVAMTRAHLMLGSTPAYKVMAKLEPVMTAAGVTPGAS